MLKEVDCKEWKVVYAKYLQDYLYQKGFRKVIEIKYNKEGKLYTIKQNKIFIQIEKIDGKPFGFYNDKNIKEFARVLAEFHNASEGFSKPPGVKMNVKWGKSLEKYKKLVKNLEKFKDIIKDKKDLTEFEKILEPYVDSLLKRSKDIMKIFRSINYLMALEDSMKRKEVCLNKISKNTALKTKRGIVIVDIFNSGYNMIEEDVAKLIRKVIEKTEKKDMFDVIISEYSKVRPLNQSSIEYIKAHVSFPYDTLKIISKYIKGEEVDLKKLKKAVYKDDICNLGV